MSTPPPPSVTNADALKPFQRLCHVIKRPDFDGYGFNLHSDKGKPGQYIGKIDNNSPAQAAGLKEGDRIIEVNGVNIGSETHKQVVQRIKAISNEVQLLVIDPTKEKEILHTQKTVLNATAVTTKTANLAQPNSDLMSSSTITIKSTSTISSPTKDNKVTMSTFSKPTSQAATSGNASSPTATAKHTITAESEKTTISTITSTSLPQQEQQILLNKHTNEHDETDSTVMMKMPSPATIIKNNDLDIKTSSANIKLTNDKTDSHMNNGNNIINNNHKENNNQITNSIINQNKNNNGTVTSPNDAQQHLMNSNHHSKIHQHSNNNKDGGIVDIKETTQQFQQTLKIEEQNNKRQQLHEQEQKLNESSNNNHNGKPIGVPTTTVPIPQQSTTNSATIKIENTQQEQQPQKTSQLNLPKSAAEMRAKLLAKKKYDPKNDAVDLRKKYEIVQKL